MSDWAANPASNPGTPTGAEPGSAHAASAPGELEVDLAAFLPEGTELAPASDVDAADAVDESMEPEGDVDGDVDGDEDPAPTTPGDAVADLPDLADLAEVEHDLDAVEQTLSALDDGTHGLCRVCGQTMPTDDLVADPIRRACASHAA